MTPWAEMEPMLRDRAYRRLVDDPEILLETDTGGLYDFDADLIYARLLGFDDEIVKDGLLLPKVMDQIFVPIHQRLTRASSDPSDLLEIEPPRTARYVLQSSFVTLSVSGFVTDPPVEKLRDNFTAKIAYLRFRRRA